MESSFVQDKNEIALAYRWAVKSIRAIQPDVQSLGVALELVTSQAVDLQSLWIVQPLLAGDDYKPMIPREAQWAAFPNLPLLEVHRSGCCRTLLMADSRATRSSSGP